MSYNLETILAEKLETVLSRGEASTRPRDRYDIISIWRLRHDEIDKSLLKIALQNTANQRGTLEKIGLWQDILHRIKLSSYQQQLWENYQRAFPYAKEIGFEETVDVIIEVLLLIEWGN